MKTIAFATHVATIGGKQYDAIGDVVRLALDTVRGRYIFVRHSMDGLLPSEVQEYVDGTIAKAHKLWVIPVIAPLRYVSEVLATTWYFSFRTKVDVFVGVDPLNALAGILLRRLGRIERAIFYTADYSSSRFGNKVLDRIYHAIDRLCVKYADEVWSVSTKIVEVRRQMGLPDEKNIFIPNAPPLEYGQLYTPDRNKYELVTLGIIDKQLDFEGVIRAMGQLKEKYPTIAFTIMGNGPDEERLKEIARTCEVEDRIIFTGRLPFQEAQARVAQAGIGLALYTGVWGFNAYGDSTKCREYFTYGLPVISTNTHATVDELLQYKAGVVVGISAESYVRAIDDILSNYDMYSKGSLELGRKYSGVHEHQLQRILEESE